MQYGMQSFDQSLMQLLLEGRRSRTRARCSTPRSPSEFALRVQGVAGTSDTSWYGLRTRRHLSRRGEPA